MFGTDGAVSGQDDGVRFVKQCQGYCVRPERTSFSHKDCTGLPISLSPANSCSLLLTLDLAYAPSCLHLQSLYPPSLAVKDQ